MFVIRPATEDDTPRLVAMGLEFHADSPYAALITANPIAMVETVWMLLEHEAGTVLVSEGPDGRLVGMIGLMAYRHPLSAEWLATELFWWVDREARGSSVGLRLLKAGEQWARDQGAVRIQMIAPDARVEKLYERQGYVRVEVNYQKTLQETT